MAAKLNLDMRSRIITGVVAGLIAGIVMGIAMHAQSMMLMVAQIVGSDSLGVGWIYHLFNAAVIGLIFGLVLGRSVRPMRLTVLRGGVYGLAWWILGGLILMPLMLGMPAFAPLTMSELHGVALFGLVVHLIYGVVLGGAYVYLPRTAIVPGRTVERSTTTTTKRTGV